MGQLFSFGDVHIETDQNNDAFMYSEELLSQDPTRSLLPGVPTGSDYEVISKTWVEVAAPAGAPGAW